MDYLNTGHKIIPSFLPASSISYTRINAFNTNIITQHYTRPNLSNLTYLRLLS